MQIHICIEALKVIPLPLLRRMPWCCLWLKRTLSTRPLTPRPPCGTVWHGLLLNPVPSSPSATYDDDTPSRFPLFTFQPPPLKPDLWHWEPVAGGLCAVAPDHPQSDCWAEPRGPSDCWAERLTHTAGSLSMQNPGPRKTPQQIESKTSLWDLKTSYINTNQDDSDDDDYGENNNK